MIEKWAQKGTTRTRKTLGSLSKDVKKKATVYENSFANLFGDFPIKL